MLIVKGDDDQVHLRWHMLEQKAKGIVDRSSIDSVVVVKDENKILLDGGDFIE